MLRLPDGNLLVQQLSELPDFTRAAEVFCDFETRSGDPKRAGDSPYHGDRICGIAITADNEPKAWYVPIRHNDDEWNLPLAGTLKWLKDILARPDYDWINHNILFDAHFADVDGIRFGGRLIDTLTLAKLHDSDRLSHALKPLLKEWLGMSTESQDHVKAWLKGMKSKDYADVPADILGRYACIDAIGVRNLYRHMVENRPDDVKNVWDTEILVTPVLFDIEDFGMPINPEQVAVEKYMALSRMEMYGEELNQLLGYEFNPKSHDQVQDLILTQFGLPVVEWTKPDKEGLKKPNPSFSKAAFNQYLVHPVVMSDPRMAKIIKYIQTYRTEFDFNSTFLTPFLNLHVDGILHPSYDQCKRTGRTSCRRPDAQAQNSRSKALIVPKPGMGILRTDYSQIEFRIIVHYINDAEAIRAYNEEPETDFHDWVAGFIGVQRKPAKTMNFMMGFGGGKAKTKKSLAANEDIIEEVSNRVNQIFDKGQEALMIEAQRVGLAVGTPITKNLLFDILCEEKASWVYETYHERLPGIKSTSRRAADAARYRGYVFNAYGRRRHLPPKACYKAFNSIIQPTAADVLKERVVAVAPRYNRRIREAGLNIFALVHDDVSFMGPTEATEDPEIQNYVRGVLESPRVKFRVPIITEMGVSRTSWANASSDKAEKMYDDKTGRQTEGVVARSGSAAEVA